MRRMSMSALVAAVLTLHVVANVDKVSFVRHISCSCHMSHGCLVVRRSAEAQQQDVKHCRNALFSVATRDVCRCKSQSLQWKQTRLPRKQTALLYMQLLEGVSMHSTCTAYQLAMSLQKLVLRPA